MSNANQEGVLRKVRALLAQAEDPAATPDEAVAFSRKAEEMIGKYAIDAALIDAKTGNGKPVVVTIEFAQTYANPKGTLLNAVAMNSNCRLIRMNGKYRMAGYQSDIEATELLYTSLLVQGEHALSLAFKSDRSFRTSFWYGFANRVNERLVERNNRQNDEVGTGTALVLADRKDIVEEFFNDEFPNTRKGRSVQLGSSAGGAAGRSAGERASFGDDHLQGNKAQALTGA